MTWRGRRFLEGGSFLLLWKNKTYRVDDTLPMQKIRALHWLFSFLYIARVIPNCFNRLESSQVTTECKYNHIDFEKFAVDISSSLLKKTMSRNKQVMIGVKNQTPIGQLLVSATKLLFFRIPKGLAKRTVLAILTPFQSVSPTLAFRTRSLFK